PQAESVARNLVDPLGHREPRRAIAHVGRGDQYLSGQLALDLERKLVGPRHHAADVGHVEALAEESGQALRVADRLLDPIREGICQDVLRDAGADGSGHGRPLAVAGRGAGVVEGLGVDQAVTSAQHRPVGELVGGAESRTEVIPVLHEDAAVEPAGAGVKQSASQLDPRGPQWAWRSAVEPASQGVEAVGYRPLVVPAQPGVDFQLRRHADVVLNVDAQPALLPRRPTVKVEKPALRRTQQEISERPRRRTATRSRARPDRSWPRCCFRSGPGTAPTPSLRLMPWSGSACGLPK